MSKKTNLKGQVLSAVVGATFFAVPYLSFGIPILPSLGIGAIAFGAGSLLFSDNSSSNNDLNKEKSFYELLNDAKKQNAEIYGMINRVEEDELQKNIEEVYELAKKIIDAVSKNPNKLNQTKSFFNYYLPVTVRILKKYDLIENQSLENDDMRKFMKSTENMVVKIRDSFKIQLANLYQSDIIDTDAEMKVFESLLKAEGFSDINDFNIK